LDDMTRDPTKKPYTVAQIASYASLAPTDGPNCLNPKQARRMDPRNNVWGT